MFLRVIDKDAANDSLTVTLKDARQEIAGNLAVGDATTSGKVGLVMGWADRQMGGGAKDVTVLDSVRANFLPIAVDLAEKEQSQKGMEQRAQRKKDKVQGQIAAGKQQKAVLPQIGRLTQGAQRGVDLGAPAHSALPAQAGSKSNGKKG